MNNHRQQPTEQVLVRAQQEREHLLKIDEQADARRYVEKFGVRHEWPEAEILEVVQALGLDQESVKVLDVVDLSF